MSGNETMWKDGKRQMSKRNSYETATHRRNRYAFLDSLTPAERERLAKLTPKDYDNSIPQPPPLRPRSEMEKEIESLKNRNEELKAALGTIKDFIERMVLTDENR